MSKPSPKAETQWQWTVDETDVTCVRDENGEYLFDCSKPIGERAVLCVNAHAALVEACQDFLVVLSFAGKKMAMSPEKLAECKAKVRAALAAADKE